MSDQFRSSDEIATTEVVPEPWYAGREVQVLIYRINRRPFAQGNLLAASDLPFLDHVGEVLLFGEPVLTGRAYQRRWLLGNRVTDEQRRYIAGVIGYSSDTLVEEADYKTDEQRWTTFVVQSQKRRLAPFIIAGASQLLFVVKHPSYAEGTIPIVFESLLSRGEQRRAAPTTDWAVEPLLDDQDFARWLASISVLDRLTFAVKLPNPDADESFQEIADHLQSMGASDLRHELKARDHNRGLSKDLDRDRISVGLQEMARRAYARIRARGRNAANRKRIYDQRQRVRKTSVELPADIGEAQSTLAELGISQRWPHELEPPK